ncbi:ATP-binding protein [Streptomyces dubilierae]|uniref:histidine kinase n=1 Tax=Streptomyces dubilierae TaxID=3075533 RepID=A0ABU2P2T8_9ACTN|nr:ATP-binding protein [Streptomyces sp. DSM 41921]MDT0386454.1 protein kinase [Streptomyces sp. DSM 41921]
MIDIPDLAVGGLAFGTLSAFALGGGLLRARRQLALQRAKTAALRARLDGTSRAFTAEVEHLAARRVPAAARQTAHPHVTVPGPLNPQLTESPLGLALEQVLKGVHAELAAQRTRIDAAAQAGMRGATREIQAALYRLQDALRGLQQRYDDPELAQTLFELDHENEQSLRRAQVAAVVCGAWVGLAREESHLVDAVTGGQARLAGYRRVRVHNHLEAGTALVSHAVEPVAIIVAELLDNALRHSAPDTEVVVNLEAVHHGVCVTVDDAGLGMSQDERARAQRMVAGDEPILLTELGDPPRMGLAAVGQLTRQFDLSVDLSSPSPYGGVRAVLRVDSHLLTRIDPEELPPAASAPRSTRAARDTGGGARPAAPATRAPAPRAAATPAPAGPARAAAPEPPTATPDHAHGTLRDDPVPGHDHDGHHNASREENAGLPQRRRRGRAAAPAGPAAEVPAPGAPQRRPRRPEEAAAALGALQSGTAAARRSAARSNTGPVPAVPENDPAAATAGTAAHDATGHDRTGPADRTDPKDRSDRTGRIDRYDQTDRNDQTDRDDRTDRNDRNDHEGGTAR